ncbi:hypothetical protein Tco_0512211 [Tanacetum coccineum]
MGSQALPRLPTIDFSNINKQNRDSVWDSTKTQVFDALQEFDCFEASFNGIERISKKRTKNEAKTTKPNTEWKSMEKTKSRQKPKSEKVNQS